MKEATGDKDWRTESQRTLPKGFIPPSELRPIIRAFQNSGKVVLMHDTSGKSLTLPHKELYLVGGPVRDFVSERSMKDMDLATDATPEQIATILTAAGFKSRAGDSHEGLKLPGHIENADGNEVKIQPATKEDKLVWFVKGRDASAAKKPFVMGAVVNGEEFDIATFRKDAKVTDGKAAVDFSDNLKDDSDRRDLTINSMYIKLDKPDGENKTLFDPTGHGLYHLKNGIVKAVGKASERFEEDPLRSQRAIRFDAKFGKGELDKDIKNSASKFAGNLHERIAPDRIRDEFIKGLVDPSVNLQRYIGHYKDTGLLSQVFPGVNLGSIADIPHEFFGKQDKLLAIAWLLQNNPIEKVQQALAGTRNVNGEQKQSGWQNQERSAIIFLLKLKEFTPDKVSEFLRHREGTGLSPKQIKEWVSLIGHKIPNKQHVEKFADYRRQVSWDSVDGTDKDKCPTCHGNPFISPNCPNCKGTGKLPPHERSGVMAKLEADHFQKSR